MDLLSQDCSIGIIVENIGKLRTIRKQNMGKTARQNRKAEERPERLRKTEEHLYRTNYGKP